ncbi:MAG: hypothetical protein ABIM89_14265 [Mycobacteriales bacterium]
MGAETRPAGDPGDRDRTGAGRATGEPVGATSKAYSTGGFYAAGSLVAVMVDEGRNGDVAAALQRLLALATGSRLLVLDMRHVVTRSAARWWVDCVSSSLPVGSELVAAHAPSGFFCDGAVVHNARFGSALPELRSSYQRVLRARSV